MFLPKAMLIQSLSVSFRRFCHLKWRQRTKKPCMDKRNSGRDLILFHFRGRMFWHIKKKAGWKKNAPGGVGVERLVDYEITGMRVGENLLNPIIRSHYTTASGGLWTALTCLILNNSSYTTFSWDSISDPSI